MKLFSLFVFLNTIFLIDCNTDGSTPYLEDIVIGRCKEYLLKKTKTTQFDPRNCRNLWKEFLKVVAFKDPCKLKVGDYETFFTASGEMEVSNKAMFWSATKSAAHFYAGYFDLMFTTLEDTFVGYMMNDLRWCGNPSLPQNSSGIDYKSCPSCLVYNKAFWREASKRFAERVSGRVRVMLNGTRGGVPAYSERSIFAQYELPNLRNQSITDFLIIVVHTISKKPNEKCNEGSIRELQKDAAEYLDPKVVRCVDDPDDVKHVLCIDKTEAEECRFLDDCPKKTEAWEIIGTVFIGLSGLLLILIAILLVCCKKRRKKGNTASY